MTDNNYLIDSHKLHYHPHRVSEWMAGGIVYPVYMEISPVSMCNHRCTFCALDHAMTAPSAIDTGLLGERIEELSEAGVRSIMYAGEGEPLLHPDIAGIISLTRAADIDTAVTTNGIPLGDIDIEVILASLSWLPISINAGNSEVYAKIHNCDEDDFEKVIGNLRKTVSVRNRSGSKSAIGVQFLLLPENRESLSELAAIVKDAGADYLTVKPYSEHLLNVKSRYSGIDYADPDAVDAELHPFNSDDFKVIVRKKSMEKLKMPREYDACPGLDFFTYMDSKGNLYPCQAFLGDNRYIMGNIYESSFKDIWNGPQRASVLKHLTSEFPGKCRRLCRLDEINRYLWRLKNPDKHDNFI